ncbi:MAG: SpoIIE family protein phosphatase [Salinivirgaceae bacterium]|nr:SpoIIE family protein phosphatase [Salinivirgaceae bacterium]
MNRKNQISQVFSIALLLLLPAFAYSAQHTDDEYVSDQTHHKVDSLLSLITADAPDSLKLKCYNQISEISDNPDTVLKYAQLALDLCDESDFYHISNAYDAISWAYYVKDEARLSLQYAIKALPFIERTGGRADKIAEECISIAKSYHELNIRDSIFMYFNRALDIYLELKDSASIAYTYRSIGMVNTDFDYKQAAAEYLQKAFVIDSVLGNYLDIADDYLFLSTTVTNHRQKLYYLKKSVAIFDSIPTDDSYYIREHSNANQRLARTYIDLARETGQRAFADSCYIYLKKNGISDSGPNDWNFLTHSCYAEYLLFCGKTQAALDVLLKCENHLSQSEINAPLLTEYYKRLTDTYTALGDYKNALASFKMQHKYQTAYANDSTLNVLASFQTEQTMRVHTAEKQRIESENRRLKTVRTSLAIGLILVFILVVLVFRMLIIKRKANRILLYKNEMLDQQNAEILAQREEIETQRDLITEQWHEVEDVNHKLLESINYARRIQRAALSSEAEINKVFPQNFVFYRPCDIVSGDFYHASQCGRYRVLVTADCTGHGIPGAFLSMLGISALKEFCVTEEDAVNPGTILDRMRNFIKTTLVSDSNFPIDDGMDMTICCFDFATMEMHYAIANQTAFIIRDGKAITLKGDKMPVGRYVIEKEHFTSQTISLQKGDTVYCFSDGIQDQLGGELSNEIGDKFLRKNLLSFLQANSGKPLETQCQLLDQTITKWRNGRQQVDDMTLVGIRV